MLKSINQALSAADTGGHLEQIAFGKGIYVSVAVKIEMHEQTFYPSPASLNSAFSAAESCDLMIVAGTSGIVQPAASLPFMAKKAGAYIIEVNVDTPPISAIADLFLKGKCGELLPGLVD